jgi:mRNA interferase MazF
MKRGQVRWYTFQRPDKRRPVLVLTRDSVLEYLGEVTVAPITTVIREIPSEVILSREDGMPRDSAVNCDHIQTIAKGKLGAVVTTLSPGRMAEVASAIDFALNLS